MKAGIGMVGRFERTKDTVQELTESAASRVGNITGIITEAVSKVAREIGDGMTDAIEMREAAQRAKADEEPPTVLDVDYEEKK